MARRLNLQEFQESILARMKSLEGGQGAATSSRLGVRVGEDDWLLSLGDVGEVLPVPEIHGVPLTHPWFLGMANVRGNLYAVTDLAAFWGGRPARLGADGRLLLAGARFGINAGLVVDRVYGLRNIADMRQKSKVVSDTPWQANVLVDADAREWRVLEIGALLNHASFMQVAA